MLTEIIAQINQRSVTVPNFLTWADHADSYFASIRAAETPAQTARRLAAEKAREEASDAAIARYSVTKKTDKWCTKGGKMKFRVPRCCKYATLFEQRICAACQSHVPEGQTHCSSSSSGRRCGEKLAGCWSHIDSKTCIYVHPDEEQWEAACNGTLCYDRDRECFHLKSETLPANRFESVARDAKSGSGLKDKSGGTTVWLSNSTSKPKRPYVDNSAW
jgi:hypothetical protein